MGVGAGLYMCDLVKKFTFAISSPDEFLLLVVVIGIVISLEHFRVVISLLATQCTSVFLEQCLIVLSVSRYKYRSEY